MPAPLIHVETTRLRGVSALHRKHHPVKPTSFIKPAPASSLQHPIVLIGQRQTVSPGPDTLAMSRMHLSCYIPIVLIGQRLTVSPADDPRAMLRTHLWHHIPQAIRRNHKELIVFCQLSGTERRLHNDWVALE